MPYLGVRNGQAVTPLDVDETATVTCPSCDGELRVRTSHYNQGKFISQHFYHVSKSDCGGESPIHQKMKTVAAMKLKEVFQTATVTPELAIGERFADVCAQFPTPLSPFGKGLVVEVQHKHKDKNIGAISHEYLDHGYSVFWAYQSDFDGHDMEFAEHRVRTVWPDAVPAVSEWSGYPACVQALRNGADSSKRSHERSVRLPREYWQTHRHEVASPTVGEAPGWRTVGEAELHGKGTEIAWFVLHRSPKGRYLLEFWRKNHATGEQDWLPVWVSGVDAATFVRFLEMADRQLGKSASYESVDRWIPIARMEFSGGERTTGWLSIAKAPRGRIKVIVGREDDRGNQRTLAVNYRKGDVHRLEGARERLSRIG